MSKVFMTLGGDLYILIDTYLLLDITTDKFISYQKVPDDVEEPERRQYFLVNKVLSYTDRCSPTDPIESIYSYHAETILSVMDKTYCGELTVVSDDFLDVWYRHG